MVKEGYIKLKNAFFLKVSQGIENAKCSVMGKYAGVSSSVCIHGNNVSIIHGDKLKIGAGTSINDYSIINARGGCEIGEKVTISSGVAIHTSSLNLDYSYKNRREKQKEITGDDHTVERVILENGVWLCSGVIVCPGVSIGEGSVVACGAVVTQNIPPFELWGGVPAVKIKELDYEDELS